MKGLESVCEHIRREFARARCVNARADAERALKQLAAVEAPVPIRPRADIRVSLDVRAEAILNRVPRVITHRHAHDGPWHVSTPRIHDQKDLDALFDEALKSLGLRHTEGGR
jgi:hypothetical protein